MKMGFSAIIITNIVLLDTYQYMHMVIADGMERVTGRVLLLVMVGKCYLRTWHWGGGSWALYFNDSTKCCCKQFTSICNKFTLTCLQFYSKTLKKLAFSSMVINTDMDRLVEYR